MLHYIIYFIPSIIVIIAWLLDRLFADPNTSLHPIVLFGKSISFFEKKLNKGKHRMLKGGLMSLFLIASVFILFMFISDFLFSKSILFYSIFSIVGLYFCLAGTTLINEVRSVFIELEKGLEQGRKQVGRIVGRETSELTAEEVKTAALETLAENLSDGVIAPLFWFALLGVEGAMAYKMINTLDSMIGYKNERYNYFGRVAAKIDDIANYIPARMTALLILIANNSLSKISFVMKYGKAHSSPNSGYPEAALAGILNCRFGGSHTYFGQIVYKPFIGDNEKELTSEDLRVSIRVSERAEVIAVLMTAIARLFILY